MALFSIPALHPGWGFFLLPAEPSILLITRPSSRGYQRSRTGCVRSELVAPKVPCALIVGTPWVRALHQWMGLWGRGLGHAEGIGCGSQLHVR